MAAFGELGILIGRLRLHCGRNELYAQSSAILTADGSLAGAVVAQIKVYEVCGVWVVSFSTAGDQHAACDRTR